MKLYIILSVLFLFIIELKSKKIGLTFTFTRNYSIEITHPKNENSINNINNIPLVIWHGMGDTCCNPLSLGSLMDFIKQQVPGIHILSLQIGGGVFEDTLTGFYGDVNKQVEDVCKQIRSDPKLQNGFNAMGFSQGGQFLRALVQRCSGIKMRNLITLGGQHQGVYGFPKCPEESSICNYARKLLDMGAYKKFVQDNIIQAQYWHDPMDAELYKQNSIFLADINQENTFNATYKANLMKLNKFVMIKFALDTMVEPKESEWFEFYKDGDTSIIVPLQQSTLYLKDLLGLKQMDADKKLVFLKVNTDHLQISSLWFKENIIPYLTST